MATGRYRFGEFEFDAGSGNLVRLDAQEPDRVQRLPPQPARLLALLIEKRGDLLTRDEIRDRLWPDVQVEFDQSLHFCIRQIRSALDDAAKGPRYVENLPKRGYRLIPAVETIEPAAASASAPVPAPAPASRRRAWTGWWLGVAVGLAALVATTLIVTGIGSGPAGKAPPRIAIMPFVPPPGMDGFGDTRAIAETILEDLVLAAGDRAEIVGPTSTSGYDDSAQSLTALAADHDLQYIVNGRFLNDAGRKQMLAELIRASDGAHIWVKRYDDLREGRRIGVEIGREVARELDLEP